MKTCLYNTQSDNVAAYCRHHNCSMTVKQIKCKNCLQKQCWYLVKNEEHDWWRQREVTKQRRKARKQALNELIN
jgi:hypothetical protein